MRAKVFIAGPVSSDPVESTRKALGIADRLLNMGFIPFVPHLCVFWSFLYPRKYGDWASYCIEWLKVCDCVLRLPGESKGADPEVILAVQLGIPVFSSLQDLYKHGRKLNEAARLKRELKWEGPAQSIINCCTCEEPDKQYSTSGCTLCWTCGKCGEFGGCDNLATLPPEQWNERLRLRRIRGESLGQPKES